MRPSTPPRLPSFPYVGLQRYFLTLCTSHRRPVMRSNEASMSVARYILENPVRAGLTRAFQDYPFSGSAEFTLAELADLWDGRT